MKRQKNIAAFAGLSVLVGIAAATAGYAALRLRESARLAHKGHDLVRLVVLRQTQAGDEGADEPVARQVDALAEGAAQHSKADALAPGDEPGKEGIAIPLAHEAVLKRCGAGSRATPRDNDATEKDRAMCSEH